MPFADALTVSVALAACNGERYLAEQLQSIAGQTRPPDELVVSDDASDDATFEMLTEFASRASFPVRVHRHRERLGVAANFSTVLSLARGDVVFTADQDDIWLEHKVEMSLAAMGSSTTAVASDATVVDSVGSETHESLWDLLRFDDRARETFRLDPRSTFLRSNPISGATAAFRSDVLRVGLPIPPGTIHDWWLLLVAASHGALALVDDPLVLYRQHENNVIGAGTTPWVEGLRRRMSGASAYSELTLFEEFATRPEAERWRPALDEKLSLLRLRASDGGNRVSRTPPIVSALLRGKYHRYARGTRSALADLVSTYGSGPPEMDSSEGGGLS